MFIIQIQGGLGNRLYQYNFYFWLKRHYPCAEVVVYTADKPIPELNSFFQDIPVLSKEKFLKKAVFCLRIEDRTFSPEKIREHGNYYFDGYWMAELFLDNEEKIRSFFASVKLNDHNKKFLALIEGSCSVFCHIRRGDMQGIPLFKNIATKEYFENALEYMSNHLTDPVFFIFSDDQDWCRALPFLKKKNVHFQIFEETTPEQDLLLMSRCKHAICSYSSFSFWGQELIREPEGLKVTPPRFLNTAKEIPMPIFHAKEISNIRAFKEAADSPLFSIIICCYQAGFHIRTALVSICNQSETDFEIICVDDCSHDQTETVIRSFAEMDNRIRYIRHEKNQGQFFARKTGLLASRGRYCWIMDSDDYLAPDALKELHEIINRAPDAEVIRFRYQEADHASGTEHPANQNFEKAGVFSGPQAVEWSLLANPTLVAIWQNVFRRDFLTGSAWWIQELPVKRKAEDLLYFLIPFHAKKIVSVENVLYNYRINEIKHDSILTSHAFLKGIVQNSALVIQSIARLPIEEEKKASVRNSYADEFETNRISSCQLYLSICETLSLLNEFRYIARYASSKGHGKKQIYLTVMRETSSFPAGIFLFLWVVSLKIKNADKLIILCWKRLPFFIRNQIAFYIYRLFPLVVERLRKGKKKQL